MPSKLTPSAFPVIPVPFIVMEPVVVDTVDPVSSIASFATGPAVKEIFPPVELTVREVRRSFPIPLRVMFPDASKSPVGVIDDPPLMVNVPAEVSVPAPE
jgi:hypothetical protein